MNTIAVDKLMSETRRLAALFRANTGATLPVSAELGRYDAAKLLHLKPLKEPGKGIDFIGTLGPYADKKILVKSRVVFEEGKSGYRIGQLNIDAPWDYITLVLYTAQYQPFEIYGAAKNDIVAALDKIPSARQQRGMMSLAKFKIISQLLWTLEFGIEWDDIWTNREA